MRLFPTTCEQVDRRAHARAAQMSTPLTTPSMLASRWLCHLRSRAYAHARAHATAEFAGRSSSSTWYCHLWWMRALAHTNARIRGIFSGALNSHVCWLNRLTHTLSSSVTFMPLSRPLSIHYRCLTVPDWSQSLAARSSCFTSVPSYCCTLM